MRQNSRSRTSSKTLRRTAAAAIAAGTLTLAAPVTVRALPGDDGPAPVLADTGASGNEPAILTAGVAMLLGGAVVIGAARVRAVRAARLAEAEDDDFLDDEYWDDEADDTGDRGGNDETGDTPAPRSDTAPTPAPPAGPAPEPRESQDDISDEKPDTDEKPGTESTDTTTPDTTPTAPEADPETDPEPTDTKPTDTKPPATPPAD